MGGISFFFDLDVVDSFKFDFGSGVMGVFVY